MARRPGSTVADLAAARRAAGERGRGNREGRRNWGVSRVADAEAKLTVAGHGGLRRDGETGSGRRRFNGGGALACAQRGEVERGLQVRK
ncbi:hypothetical protein Zm00014a_020970 [Zea mays]|uniref:Uncharacterized protein n=1 Tax=Zea mays TaxID=4577 RepID=A0A317YFG2_MAIZE|nr:hypothetical protein Zm00014a_020970 [Zea mays]